MSDETTDVPADAPWWARWLAEEWKSCWKWLNTYLVLIVTALPGAYEELPAQYKSNVPPSLLHWMEVAVGVCIFINLLKRK